MPGAARSPGLRVSEAPVLRLFGAPELFCVGSCSGLRILEVLHFLARLGLGLGRLRHPELLGLNGVTEENVTSSWDSARRVDSELSPPKLVFLTFGSKTTEGKALLFRWQQSSNDRPGSW